MEPNVQNSSTPSTVFVKPSKTTLSSGPNPFKKRCDTYKKYNQSPKGIERKKRYKIKQQLKKQGTTFFIRSVLYDQMKKKNLLLKRNYNSFFFKKLNRWRVNSQCYSK